MNDWAVWLWIAQKSKPFWLKNTWNEELNLLDDEIYYG